MSTMRHYVVVMLLSAVSATSAMALDRCRVGQRVKSPAGPGTVVAIQNGGVGCTVQVDGRPAGQVDTYGAFMLDALPGAEAAPRGGANAAARPAAARGPAVGRYDCTGGAGGNLVIRILSATRYANAQGRSGTFALIGPAADRPEIMRFRFVSGPWASYFGAVLDGGRLGLTSKPDGTFYQMTCDRRGS